VHNCTRDEERPFEFGDQVEPAMRVSLIKLCIPLILGFSSHAEADDALNPKNGDFLVSNFRFSAGETLPELRRGQSQAPGP
jgi:hypothetical protein